MALLLPVLLLILVGALDLGRVFFGYITITNAAREGARHGANYPLVDADIRNAVVQEASSSGFALNSGNVSVSRTGYAPGDSITVTVQADFPLITGYVLGGVTIRLSNSATMSILHGYGT